MPSRSRGGALQDLIGPLQLVVDCVSTAIVIFRGDINSDLIQELRPTQQPAQLQGDTRQWLEIRHDFRIGPAPETRGWWVVRPAGYAYQLYDEAERELFAYHWHPHGDSHVTFPHIHFGHDIGNIPEILKEAHFPTGPVTLAEVVRLLVADFGVRPRRPDWPAVLDRAQTALAMLHL